MKIDFAKALETICIAVVAFFVGLDTHSSIGVATMLALFLIQDIKTAIKGATK